MFRTNLLNVLQIGKKDNGSMLLSRQLFNELFQYDAHRELATTTTTVDGRSDRSRRCPRQSVRRSGGRQLVKSAGVI